ncbi:MAG: hypothetical protein K6G55_02200 [Selenomonadaceae bacterium]|nr:hypothetical protein [Selenomonadaceae bacterium]
MKRSKLSNLIRKFFNVREKRILPPDNSKVAQISAEENKTVGNTDTKVVTTENNTR